MSYIDGTVDAPMDADESHNEAVASKQKFMDWLAHIGVFPDVTINDLKDGCAAAGISFDEFEFYTGGRK